MKAVKGIVNNNKGFVAFLLLFCFLTTGFAKGLNINLLSHGSASKKQLAKQMLSVAEDDAAQSFLDKFDGDTDDADLFFHEPFPAQKFSFAETISIVTTSAYSQYSENYNVALYDLYCNWKFHLI